MISKWHAAAVAVCWTLSSAQISIERVLTNSSLRVGGPGKHMQRLRICKAFNMLQWTKVSFSAQIGSFYTFTLMWMIRFSSDAWVDW